MKISNPTAKFGEEIATNFLKKKGYKVIERNFRRGYGEIDIIAIHDNVSVFVEVKTRTTELYGGAIEAISYGKLQKLTRTCQYYKMLHPNFPESMRIDAILIDLIGGEVKNIEHIENISS